MTLHQSPPPDTRLWHPFAAMGTVRHAELVIERGEDVWVFDASGRRLLDATASLWYANVGHGRRQIADAAAEQMTRLAGYSCFGDFANRPALELSGRLADLAPVDDARVFLGSGGGDGIDTAAKLARRHFAERGQPERVHVISRTAAYHGTHAFGTSLAGIPANAAGWGELVPATSVVDRDSVEALRGEIARLGPERVAAFFAEPVIGAGGVHPPAPGYLEGCAEVCREAGVLFVADCVIAGFGRLGGWTGVERFGLRPDMLVFAKGVTSGYLPLGGVIVAGHVAAPFWDRPDAPVFRHGATYAGHPAACAAALANMTILEHEGLLARGAELEGDLLAVLAPLADHPLVAEVRGGVGLLAAVELDAGLLADAPQAPAAVAAVARDAGVLVRPLGTAVALSPPLTVTREHLELAAAALRTGLDHTLAARGEPAADVAAARP